MSPEKQNRESVRRNATDVIRPDLTPHQGRQVYQHHDRAHGQDRDATYGPFTASACRRCQKQWQCYDEWLPQIGGQHTDAPTPLSVGCHQPVAKVDVLVWRNGQCVNPIITMVRSMLTQGQPDDVIVSIDLGVCPLQNGQVGLSQ